MTDDVLWVTMMFDGNDFLLGSWTDNERGLRGFGINRWSNRRSYAEQLNLPFNDRGLRVMCDMVECRDV